MLQLQPATAPRRHTVIFEHHRMEPEVRALRLQHASAPRLSPSSAAECQQTMNRVASCCTAAPTNAALPAAAPPAATPPPAPSFVLLPADAWCAADCRACGRLPAGCAARLPGHSRQAPALPGRHLTAGCRAADCRATRIRATALPTSDDAAVRGLRLAASVFDRLVFVAFFQGSDWSSLRVER